MNLSRGTHVAPHARMKVWNRLAPFASLAVVSTALVVAGTGCSSADATSVDTSGSAVPLPSDQATVLGTYQVTLRAAQGSYERVVRVDFVNQDGKLAGFLQSRYVYQLGFVRLAIVSIDDDKIEATFESNGATGTFTVQRGADGKPFSASIVGGGPSADGTFEPDTVAPTLTQTTPDLPWEVSTIGLSEGVLARDVSIAPRGDAVYSLVPIADTPWIGKIGVRLPLASTWDAAVDRQNASPVVEGIEAKDPSGNSLERREISFRPLAIGKATKAYDFSKDPPAFPATVSRLVGDCDGAESCLRVSNGSRIALRIAAGNKTLRLRYALRAGQGAAAAPKSAIALTMLLVPGDGAEPVTTKPIEVAWSALSSPTATRAFSTPWVDLVVPLPREGVETGITLHFDGEVDAAPATAAPASTVDARHVILLLKSATAE